MSFRHLKEFLVQGILFSVYFSLIKKNFSVPTSKPVEPVNVIVAWKCVKNEWAWVSFQFIKKKFAKSVQMSNSSVTMKSSRSKLKKVIFWGNFFFCNFWTGFSKIFFLGMEHGHEIAYFGEGEPMVDGEPGDLRVVLRWVFTFL